MAEFIEMRPEEFEQSPFRLIGTDWMLIAATMDGRTNAMTASWGGLGRMWNKNVAFVFIRPQRFTKTIVDGAETFSLTFYDEGYRKMLGYMGSVSGRDDNKIKNSGLTLLHEEGTPYFREARAAILCRKLYAQALRPECFLDGTLDAQHYPDSDHHTLYIAEVTKLLVKA